MEMPVVLGGLAVWLMIEKKFNVVSVGTRNRSTTGRLWLCSWLHADVAEYFKPFIIQNVLERGGT